MILGSILIIRDYSNTLRCFSRFLKTGDYTNCSMSYREQYGTLLYQYEVLRTRLKIREHYLGTVVKEVYENIGQMLSLIRVKLSTLQLGFESSATETIDSSGEMVGKTINELRSMCRLFYPEEEIISGYGFYKVISEEIRVKFPEATCFIDDTIKVTDDIRGEKGLIVFGILLEIISMLDKHQPAKIVSATINQDKNKIIFIVTYSGEMTWEKNKKDASGFFDLTIFDRAELLGGRLQIKTKGHDVRRIKLEVPIN